MKLLGRKSGYRWYLQTVVLALVSRRKQRRGSSPIGSSTGEKKDLPPQPVADSSPPAPSGSGWRPSSGADQEPDAGAVHQPPARGTIPGEVRGFQAQTEEGFQGTPITVWRFRLERYDSAGNHLPPVPVEMRGKSFIGFINEGDEVEVYGKLKEGQVVRAARVYNSSAKVMVRSRTSSASMTILLIPVVLFGPPAMMGFFLLLLFIIRGLITGH